MSDGLTPYAETVVGRFPVEPLNTVSCLAFILVALYWAYRTRLNICRYPLIVMVVPLLVVGGVGGMVHHAFRTYRAWRHIDILMAFYGVAMGCVYFWRRVSQGWFKAFLLTLLFPLFLRIVLYDVKINSASVVFVGMALALAIPLAIDGFRSGGKHMGMPMAASLLFCVAVFFRELDAFPEIVGKYGTHFLWHLFAAVSVCVVLSYVYHLNIGNPSRGEKHFKGGALD